MKLLYMSKESVGESEREVDSNNSKAVGSEKGRLGPGGGCWLVLLWDLMRPHGTIRLSPS